ncbi:MAG: alanine--tRNA ligase, partial [Lachnospiraceae bacterium]|nr:alanine--tRNA ligase [Lachnospiraceae bacterium]
FGEKYDNDVRVVSMGDFSKELCGGTHVKNTGIISQFKIVSEAGIAAGTRRIEALTSKGLKHYYDGVEEELKKACTVVKAEPSMLIKKLESLTEELKALSSENESLKSKLASNSLGDITDNIKEVKGVKLVAACVKGADMTGLVNLGDKLKGELGDCVVVLASDGDGKKVSLLAMATEGAIKKGAHAGNLIKQIAPIVGGGGGGRPNMAQAGGKKPEMIDEAIGSAEKILEGQLA